MRVLIAEDDLVSRTLLAKAIKLLGHETETASDGNEAWKKYATNGADVVLTDWGMPGLDGAELCRRVRETPYPNNPYTYVVFLTAHSTADYRTAAMLGGADDFLTKPLDSDALEARLIAAERVTALHGRLHGQAQVLRQNEATLRAFYDSTGLSMGIVELLEEEDDVLHISANRETARLYGTTPEGIQNQRASRLGTSPEYIQNLLRHSKHCRNAGRTTSFEYERDTRWMSATLSCIGAADNGRMRFAYVTQDITERKLRELSLQGENAELEVLATRDPLTGVANRRMLWDQMEKAIEFARRHHTPLSVLLLDVDKFKHYNDTFGHPAGDTALQSVAQLLSHSARAMDLVARFGGEEFAVLLQKTDADGALEVAERCRRTVEAHTWPHRPITISLGTATLSGTESKEDLLQRADDALFVAKREGRNQVRQG